MKTILLIIIAPLLFITTAKAQIIYVDQTTNTWYVNAPTSGCNGIWAINRTQWPCSLGCSYAAASPMGCLTSFFPTCDSIIGDTLFLKLCSVPCNLAANCDTNIAICGTGTPINITGIDVKKRKKNIKLFPNPSNGKITLECNLEENETGTLTIYDLTGNIVGSYKLPVGIKTLDVNSASLSTGVYQYEILINDKSVCRDKLIIIK